MQVTNGNNKDSEKSSLLTYLKSFTVGIIYKKSSNEHNSSKMALKIIEMIKMKEGTLPKIASCFFANTAQLGYIKDRLIRTVMLPHACFLLLIMKERTRIFN